MVTSTHHVCQNGGGFQRSASSGAPNRQTHMHYYVQTPIQNVLCNLGRGPTLVTVPNLGSNHKQGKHVLIEM